MYIDYCYWFSHISILLSISPHLKFFPSSTTARNPDWHNNTKLTREKSKWCSCPTTRPTRRWPWCSTGSAKLIVGTAKDEEIEGVLEPAGNHLIVRQVGEESTAKGGRFGLEGVALNAGIRRGWPAAGGGRRQSRDRRREERRSGVAKRIANWEEGAPSEEGSTIGREGQRREEGACRREERRRREREEGAPPGSARDLGAPCCIGRTPGWRRQRWMAGGSRRSSSLGGAANRAGRRCRAGGRRETPGGAVNRGSRGRPGGASHLRAGEGGTARSWGEKTGRGGTARSWVEDGASVRVGCGGRARWAGSGTE